MKQSSILILFLIWGWQVSAQFGMSAAQRDSIRRLTEKDYQDMLYKLHIKEVRRGVNGNNPKAPNAANYDESKANPYPDLPDPLIFNNGKPVKTEQDWWNRRKEIVEDFDREVYGRVPANTPIVNWEVLEKKDTVFDGITATQTRLRGHVDNSNDPSIEVNIQLTLTLPKSETKPVPVAMEFSFGSFPRRPGDTTSYPAPAWEINCLKRGWGFAILIPTSVQADWGAGLRVGIIGLMNKGRYRMPEDWGALRAWAWGASRAMDYFESNARVDAKHVAIAGHSRYGKAALVTMAYDTRFAAGYISSSGEAGAKLSRRNAGEIVENVAGGSEYHWMAGNFIKYAGPLHWNDLPVDAHELIALCAPRPVFISSGDKGDAWVDARGMFMAAEAAGPVYRLLGKKGLPKTDMPPVGTGLLDGEIAFRQHHQGHTPAPNWPYFLDFAARYFKDQ